MSSKDPEVWKAAFDKDIKDYILRFGDDDNERTRQVRRWRDQVGVYIAEKQLAAWKVELARVVEVELPALERRLDAAGVPWTPGRPLP